MILSKTNGLIATFSALVLWAGGVLFWPLLSYLDAFTVLCQRVLWSAIFVFFILLFTKQLNSVLEIFKDSKQLVLLIGSAIGLASNWYIFIWTVSNDSALESSLGYFLSPIMNILLARIFLKEKLKKAQAIAFGIVLIAIFYNIISYGTFPVYAFILGFSFALYTVLHKITRIEPILAFFAETILMMPICLAWLFYTLPENFGVFGYGSMHYFYLLTSIVFTAVPLILFTYGVQSLTLITLSFIQYTNPSLVFILAVTVTGEQVSPADYITFPLIWLALAVVIFDTYKTYKKAKTSTGKF